MPPYHGERWRYGQTKAHRDNYDSYVQKKIAIFKNDKKDREMLLKHAWATKHKLKNRIQAVHLRKKLPKRLRFVRRNRMGDDADDSQDDSDSGPT